MIIAVVLILLGILFLGVNFNFISADVWSQLLKLWPMILIIIGVGIIIKRLLPKWLYYLIIAVLLVLIVLGAIYVSQCNNEPEGGQNISLDEPISSGFDKYNLTIKLGAQNLEINDISSGLISGNIQANGGTPVYRQSTSNSAIIGVITQNWRLIWSKWGIGGAKGTSRLYITNQIPLDLTLNLGATSINADLSRIKLEYMNLNTGAFDGQIKLGKLAQSASIIVRTGASNVSFKTPKDCGVKVASSSGLVTTKYTNIDVKDSGGDKISNNYNSAQCKIDFNIKSGASSFEFVGY